MSDKKTKKYLSEQKNLAAELTEDIVEEEVLEVIKAIEDSAKKGGMIFTVGNGGSSSTAKHLAADLDKTVDQEIDLNVNSYSLVSNESLLTAWTNDEGWKEVYKGQLEGKISEEDVLIAISVHGGSGPWSGNLVKALDHANKKGATTVGISGFDGGKFKETCDIPVVVKVDSTPLVESLHVLLHHMIVFGLEEKRENESC